MNDFYNEQDNGYGFGAPSAFDSNANNLSGVAKIKVIGVGGAGNNAVDRLIESGLQSAEYIVVNTDNQALARSKASNRIQIGVKLTKGLGAGADPSVGRAAAEENKEAIQEALKDTDLLFITAGMGGGTGTGAAPIIAKIAKDMKILTVAVVTLPFSFEAKRRMDNATVGIEELRKSVDSIITIPNDKIRQVVPKGTSFSDSLKVADEVLRQGIRGIAELIVKPSLINLDFADVKTTLKGRGLAHMGIGVAKGEKRISDAVRCAVCSPLLNTTIEGASSVILNIIGGKDLSLDEIVMAADLVKGVIDYSANVIFGACIDENMSDEVEVVIIATGFNSQQNSISNEAQEAAMRQATILSQKIDGAYAPANEQFYSAPVQQPALGYAQPMPPYAPQPSYGAQQGQPLGGYAPVYPQPMQQQPVAQPTEEGAFEPGDPIPEPIPQQTEEQKDRKHRPRFVDYFMRKNNDK
ncbi:MAG: cell division protein FtsZ [Clostridiales bacterium]|nr:cell division protein FtsZ [Clostridiales bacterium]